MMDLKPHTSKARTLLARGTVVLAAIMVADPALAQEAAVSPVTITPETLVPTTADRAIHVDIPESGALHPPAGAEKLAVTLGSVKVEGAFPAVAEQVHALTARLEGRRASLVEIYAVASEVEAAHARAGYVLARVSLPPQDLQDGGSLRIIVIDGFIEAVDASALPSRIRGPIAARARRLVRKPRLTMNKIETALMLMSNLPGFELRSTIMRGSTAGGAKLVLEGRQQLVTGYLGIANDFDSSLGRWNEALGVSINSLFGLGEQIYGFGSSDYRLDHLFSDNSRARVGGGGVMMPIDGSPFTINPEVTFARTAPEPMKGAPYTVGTLRRLTLRTDATLVHLRREQAGLTLSFEQIYEANNAPDFATTLTRDRYIAARVAADWSRQTSNGARYSARVQLSQGLGNLGAIRLAEAQARGQWWHHRDVG